MNTIKIKTDGSLLSELASLQVKGEMCDTRLVGDNGSMMVHWPVLEVSGVWWSQSRPGSHNTVIFPGVSLAELTSFVKRIYSLSEPEMTLVHNAWMNDVSAWMNEKCLDQYTELLSQESTNKQS